MTTPLEPSTAFLNMFLSPSLLAAKSYHLDAPNVGVKLDQNESPWDWPESVKTAVLNKLKTMPWNRYPSPFADELVAKISKKLNIPSSSILLGPGSNYLIALVLQTFSKKIAGKVVLTRPSFALYESHCNYEGIPYEVWPLSADLEYDVNLLPPLPKGSMVVFASPNNPVGNVLSKKVFKELLAKYPDVMWIADEAYCEFSDEPYTDLLSVYSNLMLIRTFSKTMGAAGVRLGYIVAGANVIDMLKKPRVPFLINQFTLAAASEVMDSPSMSNVFDEIVKNAIKERKRLASELQPCSKKLKFEVKSSEANFLLLRWKTSEESNVIYKKLVEAGILVRNVSGAPGLAGCLRVSVGTEKENDLLLKAFNTF